MNVSCRMGIPWPCTDAGPACGIARAVRRHPDRTLGFWVLGLPLSGRIAVAVGDEELVADGGGYYLLPPGVPHRGTGDGLADIAYFHFRCGSRGSAVSLGIAGRRPRQLDYGALAQFLGDLAAAGVLSDAVFSQQVAAVLGQLAIEAARPVVPAATRQIAEAVLDLLHARFPERLPAIHIARLMGYSYGHLDRCFRQTFGDSIHVRLIAIRIASARAQLLHGRSVRAAASACGFGDEGHFRKTFTRLVGLPPGRFAVSGQG